MIPSQEALDGLMMKRALLGKFRPNFDTWSLKGLRRTTTLNASPSNEDPTMMSWARLHMTN